MIEYLFCVVSGSLLAGLYVSLRRNVATLARDAVRALSEKVDSNDEEWNSFVVHVHRLDAERSRRRSATNCDSILPVAVDGCCEGNRLGASSCGCGLRFSGAEVGGRVENDAYTSEAWPQKYLGDIDCE